RVQMITLCKYWHELELSFLHFTEIGSVMRHRQLRRAERRAQCKTRARVDSSNANPTRTSCGRVRCPQSGRAIHWEILPVDGPVTGVVRSWCRRWGHEEDAAGKGMSLGTIGR